MRNDSLGKPWKMRRVFKKFMGMHVMKKLYILQNVLHQNVCFNSIFTQTFKVPYAHLCFLYLSINLEWDFLICWLQKIHSILSSTYSKTEPPLMCCYYPLYGQLITKCYFGFLKLFLGKHISTQIFRCISMHIGSNYLSKVIFIFKNSC